MSNLITDPIENQLELDVPRVRGRAQQQAQAQTPQLSMLPNPDVQARAQVQPDFSGIQTGQSIAQEAVTNQANIAQQQLQQAYDNARVNELNRTSFPALIGGRSDFEDDFEDFYNRLAGINQPEPQLPLSSVGQLGALPATGVNAFRQRMLENPGDITGNRWMQNLTQAEQEFNPLRGRFGQMGNGLLGLFGYYWNVRTQTPMGLVADVTANTSALIGGWWEGMRTPTGASNPVGEVINRARNSHQNYTSTLRQIYPNSVPYTAQPLLGRDLSFSGSTLEGTTNDTYSTGVNISVLNSTWNTNFGVNPFADGLERIFGGTNAEDEIRASVEFQRGAGEENSFSWTNLARSIISGSTGGGGALGGIYGGSSYAASSLARITGGGLGAITGSSDSGARIAARRVTALGLDMFLDFGNVVDNANFLIRAADRAGVSDDVLRRLDPERAADIISARVNRLRGITDRPVDLTPAADPWTTPVEFANAVERPDLSDPWMSPPTVSERPRLLLPAARDERPPLALPAGNGERWTIPDPFNTPDITPRTARLPNQPEIVRPALRLRGAPDSPALPSADEARWSVPNPWDNTDATLVVNPPARVDVPQLSPQRQLAGAQTPLTLPSGSLTPPAPQTRLRGQQSVISEDRVLTTPQRIDWRNDPLDEAMEQRIAQEVPDVVEVEVVRTGVDVVVDNNTSASREARVAEALEAGRRGELTENEVRSVQIQERLGIRNTLDYANDNETITRLADELPEYTNDQTLDLARRLLDGDMQISPGTRREFLMGAVGQLRNRLGEEARPVVNTATASNENVNALVERAAASIDETTGFSDGGFLPFDEVRALLPNMSREQQDSLLFTLQREGAAELNTIQTGGRYTTEQQAAGIPQELAGDLFFLTITDPDKARAIISEATGLRQDAIVNRLGITPTIDPIDQAAVDALADTIPEMSDSEKLDLLRSVLADTTGFRPLTNAGIATQLVNELPPSAFDVQRAVGNTASAVTLPSADVSATPAIARVMDEAPVAVPRTPEAVAPSAPTVDLTPMFREYDTREWAQLVEEVSRIPGATLNVSPRLGGARRPQDVHRLAGLIPSPSDPTRPLLAPLRGDVDAYLAKYGVPHPFADYAVSKPRSSGLSVSDSARDLRGRLAELRELRVSRELTKSEAAEYTRLSTNLKRSASLVDLSTEQPNNFYRNLVSPTGRNIPQELVEAIERGYATGEGIKLRLTENVEIPTTLSAPVTPANLSDTQLDLARRGTEAFMQSKALDPTTTILAMPNNGKLFWDGVTGQPAVRKFGDASFAGKARAQMSYPFDVTPSVSETRSAISESLTQARTIEEVIDRARKLEQQYPDLAEQIRADAGLRIDELDNPVGLNTSESLDVSLDVQEVSRQLDSEVTSYEQDKLALAQIDSALDALIREQDTITQVDSVVRDATRSAEEFRQQTSQVEALLRAIDNLPNQADRVAQVINPRLSIDSITELLNGGYNLSAIRKYSADEAIDAVDTAELSLKELEMVERFAQRTGQTADELLQSAKLTPEDLRDVLSTIQQISSDKVENSLRVMRRDTKLQMGSLLDANKLYTLDLGDIRVIAPSTLDGIDSILSFVRTRIALNRMGIEGTQNRLPFATDVFLTDRITKQGTAGTVRGLAYRSAPGLVEGRGTMVLSSSATVGTFHHESGHLLDGYLRRLRRRRLDDEVSILGEYQPSKYGRSSSAEDVAESYGTSVLPDWRNRDTDQNFAEWYGQVPERRDIISSALQDAWNIAQKNGHTVERIDTQGQLLAQVRERLVSRLQSSIEKQTQLGQRLFERIEELRQIETTASSTDLASRTRQARESLANTFQSLSTNTSNKCL